jgi:hypothetical protein
MNRRKRLLQMGMVGTAALAGLLLLFLLLSRWPGAGARLATPLRRLIGNERVGQLETIFFTAEDRLRRWQYSAGLTEPRSPWLIEMEATPLPAAATTFLPLTPTPRPPALPHSSSALIGAPNPGAGTPDPSPASTGTPDPSPASTLPAPAPGQPAATTTLAPLPTATPWSLPTVVPFGLLTGEGIWLPYLFDESGEPAALRTFLQPDPERPYTVVAIVAFDLERTRLHYTLGSEEPALPGGPRGHGRIPAAVVESGRLLATFNGGFLGAHGEYGAMQEGVVALPAKIGYGTVIIDPDGRVQIGEWGRDVDEQSDYLSWRQNARLIVDAGNISERVYNRSIATWGGSIDGSIVTWRSAIGLSADEQVLYYFAGPSVSMPVLAAVMQTVGVHNGILLDINATWVHFAAVRQVNGRLQAEPLFAEGMETNVDRYLRQSARDFFYVTLREDKR